MSHYMHVCEQLLPLRQALLLQTTIRLQTGSECPCALGLACPLLPADPHSADVEAIEVPPPRRRVEEHARPA